MQEQAPATITITEAAKLLGISRQTGYDLANEGKLPGAIRLGWRWVVSRQVIEAVLAGQSN